MVTKALRCLPRLALPCVLAMAAPLGTAQGLQPWSATRHDAAIASWREGRLPSGELLRQLEDWMQTIGSESRSRVHSDRLVVAFESGDLATVVQGARALPLDEVQAYALPAVIAAARAAGDPSLQAQAVARLLSLQPGSWEAGVQEALWLIDVQRLDDAAGSVEALARRAQAGLLPQAVNIFELRAALAEARGQPAVALGNYQQVLRLAPQHRHAQRAQSLLLARAGTPEGALQQAAGSTPLFSPLERARLRQDALGERVRWATAMPDTPAPARARRRAALDQVIQDGESLAREWAARVETDHAGEWLQLEARLTADRMRALLERGRTSEVLSLHARATAGGKTVPWYGKAAAAAAWARQRDSARAIPLYEEAVRDAGTALNPPSDVHTGLVHAYVDSGRFREADALLARLLDETPAHLRLSPVSGRPNAEHGELLALRGRVELDTGRTKAARQRFDTLANEAPLSVPYRTGLASALLATDRPQAALAQLQALAHEHPDDVQVQADLGEALLANGWFAAGRRHIDSVGQAYPEHHAVPGAVRTRDSVLGARMEVDAGAARDGGTLSQREQGLQLRLSSGWSDAGLSLFYRHWFARAQLTDARIAVHRAGIGVQWRQGPWRASAELHRANWAGREWGGEFTLGWRPTDAWQFSAGWDSNAIEVPWRAREAGVAGRIAHAQAEALVGDSMRWSVRAEQLALTDENRRRALLVAWRQGWLQSPRLQLQSSLSAEVAGFERSEPAYFSPTQERSLALEGEARWLTWKRDDRHLVQVVQAGAGVYAQAGHGSGPLWSGSYAHEWTWGAGWLLRYGIGIRSHPYDGVSEQRRDVFIRLAAPLP